VVLRFKKSHEHPVIHGSELCLAVTSKWVSANELCLAYGSKKIIHDSLACRWYHWHGHEMTSVFGRRACDLQVV
jgi:hypothetical protein